MIFLMKFLPSEVMNRPQGNFKANPPGITGKELQKPVYVEKKAAADCTTTNSL
jgi:hypothetical protein